MTELSSALDSLEELGNKEISLLYSDDSINVLFRPVQGIGDEQLLEMDSIGPDQIVGTMMQKGRDFHSATVFSSTPQVTCVPDGLFDETKSVLYLDSVFGKQRNREAISVHIPTLSLHYVFAIEQSLHTSIKKAFPQVRLKHLCESLLIEAWAEHGHGDEVIFRLHQEKNSLFLIVLKGKELKLFTHHHIGDATDIVYHSLNTIHAMGIDHAEADLACSGSLSTESEAFSLLRSYCPNCHFKMAEFSELKAPHQFILAAQSYCE